MAYAHADILELLKKQAIEVDARLLLEKLKEVNKTKGK